MDGIINLLIVLLILSMITEKITFFLRKNVPSVRNNERFNFWLKGPPTDENKAKDAALLSTFVGILVSILTNASLFVLLTKAGDGFSDYNFNPIGFCNNFSEAPINTIFGTFLTGFFLSFGSKFFHDLLDTVLQVKNLKRKLNEKETYEIENIRELDEWLTIGDGELVAKAIDQNEEIIDKWGASGVSIGSLEYKGKTSKGIVLGFDDSPSLKIPESIKATLDSGRTLNVPIRVIYNQGETGILAGPGGIVYAEGHPGIKGTLTCLVKNEDGKTNWLTCCHNLNGGASRVPDNYKGKEIMHSENAPLGEWGYAKLNSRYDIALVETDETSENIDNKIPSSFNSISMYKGDEILDKSVEIFGITSKHKKGIVFSRRATKTVRYDDGNEIKLENLLVLTNPESNNNLQTISKQGDSGAPVWDKDNNLVGMVVAGNSKFTYVIPMKSVYYLLDIKLI